MIILYLLFKLCCNALQYFLQINTFFGGNNLFICEKLSTSAFLSTVVNLLREISAENFINFELNSVMLMMIKFN